MRERQSVRQKELAVANLFIKKYKYINGFNEFVLARDFFYFSRKIGTERGRESKTKIEKERAGERI